MADPGAIPLPDFITLIILAALGLLGFLLLTRYVFMSIALTKAFK